MQATETLIVVTTTFSSMREAVRVSEMLVSEQLCACAQLHGAVTSFYRWEGEIERAEEIPASFKVSKGKQEEFYARFQALHSYEVPQYIWNEEKCSLEYGVWVDQS